MEEAIALNLGCGPNKAITIEGVKCLNVDSNEKWKPEYLIDLENGLGVFEDNSISYVAAFHVFEHINNFVALMRDIHRICKNGALLYVKVPEAPTKFAFVDPTHVRFFTNESFYYFDNFRDLYDFPHFKVIKVESLKGGEEMHVLLEVVKDGVC